MSELSIPISELLNRPRPTLAQRNGGAAGRPGGTYPINPERLTSSARVLDMLCQIATKPWADDVCLAGLVRCLNDLLQPQAHLCSMGADRRLDGAEIMRMTKRAREQVNI